MLLHLSVSHSVHGGCRQTPPWADIPPEMATEAGGPHPTGMHFCCKLYFISFIIHLIRHLIMKKLECNPEAKHDIIVSPLEEQPVCHFNDKNFYPDYMLAFQRSLGRV